MLPAQFPLQLVGTLNPHGTAGTLAIQCVFCQLRVAKIQLSFHFKKVVWVEAGQWRTRLSSRVIMCKGGAEGPGSSPRSAESALQVRGAACRCLSLSSQSPLLGGDSPCTVHASSCAPPACSYLCSLLMANERLLQIRKSGRFF